jgi:hypothetical protein
MKKIALLSLIFALTGCDPFEGTLSVKQEFTVKSTEKSSGCNQLNSSDCDQIVNVKIPVGDVSAKFEFPSKKEIQIKLKINGKKKTLNLDLPKKLSIPSNGQFSVSAADLGQDFGAAGLSETKVTDGPVQKETEECNYTRYEVRCHVVNNQTVCRRVPVNVWGRRWVEFHERKTEQKMAVNFGSADNIIAHFNGARNYTERVILNQGQCF